jgi:hypothetical protein
VPLTINRLDVLDRAHHNGDPYWDGDQTAYELELADESGSESFVVVVPRGDAFITTDEVARYLIGRGLGVAELRAGARPPVEGRRPQVVIGIESGWDDGASVDAPTT